MTSILRSSLLLGLITTSVAEAQSYVINFDSLRSGNEANLAAPSGVRFSEGTFSPNLDSNGDAILNSNRWRTADLAQSILVSNPADYGRGLAPSGALALDSVFQPTLLRFSSPQNLQTFSITLDRDPLGESVSTINFYSVGIDSNSLLGSISVNQTIPGFIGSLSSPLKGVDMIVLPSGALYDNISFSGSAVPEPAESALAALGLCSWGLWAFVRRRLSNQ